MIQRFYKEITPVGGTVSTTIRILTHSHCKQIIIEPATPTTTYDYAVTENYHNSMTMHGEENITGKHRIAPQFSTFFTLTLEITNASADEQFNILMTFDEVI